MRAAESVLIALTIPVFSSIFIAIIVGGEFDLIGMVSYCLKQIIVWPLTLARNSILWPFGIITISLIILTIYWGCKVPRNRNIAFNISSLIWTIVGMYIMFTSGMVNVH